MVHHWTDIIEAIIQDLPGAVNAIMRCFKCQDESPVSPTLSAQEGELDNLLSDPSVGWDDLPRSRGYNKKGGMKFDPDNTERYGREAAMATARPQPTWTVGRTMEELEREEADLAKMDKPGPPPERDEFGDFEQAPSDPDVQDRSASSHHDE